MNVVYLVSFHYWLIWLWEYWKLSCKGNDIIKTGPSIFCMYFYKQLDLPGEQECHCSLLYQPTPSTHHPHPPVLPPSPSSPPHQHIPTHWHCNCQAHGRWTILPAAGRMPPLILTLLHNDKPGLLQRLCSGGLQGHSCLQSVFSSLYHICAIQEYLGIEESKL